MADAKTTVSYLSLCLFLVIVGFFCFQVGFFGLVNMDAVLQSVGMSGYLSFPTASFKRNIRQNLTKFLLNFLSKKTKIIECQLVSVVSSVVTLCQEMLYHYVAGLFNGDCLNSYARLGVSLRTESLLPQKESVLVTKCVSYDSFLP